MVFGCERYLRWESSYMQKIPYHEYVESYENNMTALETLEKINQQTNSLEKYLKGLHLPHFKEKAFLRYYENLKYYTEVLDYNLSVGMWDFGSIAGISTINVNGVLVSASVTREMHDGYPTTQINEPFIEKPMTKTIKLVYSGEGMYSPVINYVYLNDEYYSKHLTTRSQKYLAIRAKQQEDLGGATYYIDGALNVTRLKLIDWIGEFQKFLSKYKGNDYLNSCAKESLKTYVSDFMYSTYNTFDFSTNKLRPEAKAGYETFLEKINKNTKEYEVVKKAYDILKKNNYTESAEFFNYVKSYKQ
ncbi:MAG: hypothetical protein LUB59_04390 [Candidatus Gastranaerophilales bacterium]|nr:hypothetical protein [Candidatus Gastranaerophilales bacterium]